MGTEKGVATITGVGEEGWSLPLTPGEASQDQTGDRGLLTNKGNAVDL